MRSRLNRLLGPRRPGVDSHDAHAFPAATWRARIFRLTFGCATVALAVAAVASARDLDTRDRGLIPSGTTGVVVVDLSLSIADEDYRAIRGAFRRLVAEDASIGLVVFSDVAYELLPPGTPASELRPMLRLLVPPAAGPAITPWTDAFRAGTRVSAAIDLAREMLERDGVRSGSILLVSDLETAPDDVPALSRTVDSLRRSSIELRVFGLAPSSDARLIFEGFLQEGAFDLRTDSGEEEAVESGATNRVSTTLLVLGVLLFLSLAVHERLAGRLAITVGPRSAP